MKQSEDLVTIWVYIFYLYMIFHMYNWSNFNSATNSMSFYCKKCSFLLVKRNLCFRSESDINLQQITTLNKRVIMSNWKYSLEKTVSAKILGLLHCLRDFALAQEGKLFYMHNAIEEQNSRMLSSFQSFNLHFTSLLLFRLLDISVLTFLHICWPFYVYRYKYTNTAMCVCVHI